jgi:hypothetical protein
MQSGAAGPAVDISHSYFCAQHGGSKQYARTHGRLQAIDSHAWKILQADMLFHNITPIKQHNQVDSAKRPGQGLALPLGCTASSPAKPRALPMSHSHQPWRRFTGASESPHKGMIIQSKAHPANAATSSPCVWAQAHSCNNHMAAAHRHTHTTSATPHVHNQLCYPTQLTTVGSSAHGVNRTAPGVRAAVSDACCWYTVKVKSGGHVHAATAQAKVGQLEHC